MGYEKMIECTEIRPMKEQVKGFSIPQHRNGQGGT